MTASNSGQADATPPAPAREGEPLRVLPAFDLMNRQLVHGMAGNRADYEPMISPLVEDANPVTFALNLRERFGIETLYLADLDGIERHNPWLELFGELKRLGFELVVDSGVTSAAEIEQLWQLGVDQVIIGLETTPQPELLSTWLRELGDGGEARRLLFSLDIKGGQPHGVVTRAADASGSTSGRKQWPATLEGVAEVVREMGITGLILMDLDSVGMGTGPRWGELLQKLRQEMGFRERIVAGGARHAADLRQLREQGATGAIVASMLHSGRITREDLLEVAS